MAFTADDKSLLLNKTPIGSWCRWELNLRSFIQLSEILPVELTGTH